MRVRGREIKRKTDKRQRRGNNEEKEKKNKKAYTKNKTHESKGLKGERKKATCMKNKTTSDILPSRN